MRPAQPPQAFGHAGKGCLFALVLFVLQRGRRPVVGGQQVFGPAQGRVGVHVHAQLCLHVPVVAQKGPALFLLLQVADALLQPAGQRLALRHHLQQVVFVAPVAQCGTFFHAQALRRAGSYVCRFCRIVALRGKAFPQLLARQPQHGAGPSLLPLHPGQFRRFVSGGAAVPVLYGALFFQPSAQQRAATGSDQHLGIAVLAVQRQVGQRRKGLQFVCLAHPLPQLAVFQPGAVQLRRAPGVKVGRRQLVTVVLARFPAAQPLKAVPVPAHRFCPHPHAALFHQPCAQRQHGAYFAPGKPVGHDPFLGDPLHQQQGFAQYIRHGGDQLLAHALAHILAVAQVAFCPAPGARDPVAFFPHLYAAFCGVVQHDLALFVRHPGAMAGAFFRLLVAHPVYNAGLLAGAAPQHRRRVVGAPRIPVGKPLRFAVADPLKRQHRVFGKAVLLARHLLKQVVRRLELIQRSLHLCVCHHPARPLTKSPSGGSPCAAVSRLLAPALRRAAAGRKTRG